MGGQQFTDIGWGKNVNEAFGETADEARYLYGHGGYTGTIAEKTQVTLLTPPDGIATEHLIARLFQYDDESGDDAIAAFVRKWGPAVDDKWGPAFAIRMTAVEEARFREMRRRSGWPAPKADDGIWTFFGWASS